MMQRTDISPLFTGGVGASSTLPLRNYYERQHILPPRRLLGNHRICGICFDAMEATDWTHSGKMSSLHAFHRKCVYRWIWQDEIPSDQKPDCPVCLHTLTPEELKSLTNRSEQIKELATLFLQNILYTLILIEEKCSPFLLPIYSVAQTSHCLSARGIGVKDQQFTDGGVMTLWGIGIATFILSSHLKRNNLGRKVWAILCKHLLRKKEPMGPKDIYSARLAIRSALITGGLLAIGCLIDPSAIQKRAPSLLSYVEWTPIIAGSLIAATKSTFLTR